MPLIGATRASSRQIKYEYASRQRILCSSVTICRDSFQLEKKGTHFLFGLEGTAKYLLASKAYFLSYVCELIKNS